MSDSPNVPTLEYLERLIDDGAEETQTLEFKAAAKLGKTDEQRADVTKRVSAMANAAGGRLIYGIAEKAGPDGRSIAGSIDPVDRTKISPETLTNVIDTIQPRIAGVRVVPVATASDGTGVCYVIDVPQGRTAHQARDLKYYRRNNTITQPMQDYEIRDVMARSEHPIVGVTMCVVIRSTVVGHHPSGDSATEDTYQLEVSVANTGSRYARFVNGWIELPRALLKRRFIDRIVDENMRLGPVARFAFDNRVRDAIGRASPPVYGPSYFVPVLPGLSRDVLEVTMDDLSYLSTRETTNILWTVHADNASPATGVSALAMIPVIDKRTLVVE